jgi:DUF4097 and DUF4098 domain-containing protein YvlB
MPTFATPDPIDLAINIQVGRIDVVTSDRKDTVVTVTPTNPDKTIDRRGVDETRVEFDGQRLTIVGLKPKISWIGSGPYDSIDVRVELPTGSRLTAEIALGPVKTSGELGATRIKSAMGAVDVDATADLWLRAAYGDASVATVDGSADITASYGQIRVDTVTGDALLKASYGGIRIGDTRGDLEAKLSYGDIDVASSQGDVTVKTAFGGIDLGEVSKGSIDVQTGFGQIYVGVRDGVPAWLDLSSKKGRVHNDLGQDAAPASTEETVSVRARTQGGDITVRLAKEVAR